MNRPLSRCHSLKRDQFVLRCPIRHAVIDRNRAVSQRPFQGHQGRCAKAAEGRRTIRLIDQTLPRRTKGLWGFGGQPRWVRRQVNRASRRQQRAHGRPEPPSAPPAPASGAEPDPGTCVQVPDEWRRPESPLAPVQSQRSGCAAASAARRRRAHRHRRGATRSPSSRRNRRNRPARETSTRSRAPRHRAAIW